ncbi:hypothetical protein PAEPH01_1403 [Pancytospora epiphaga]|nr:hypothetical protein PAEPH01_1403 [Pancytospora epiphaga]
MTLKNKEEKKDFLKRKFAQLRVSGTHATGSSTTNNNNNVNKLTGFFILSTIILILLIIKLSINGLTHLKISINMKKGDRQPNIKKKDNIQSNKNRKRNKIY